MLIPTLAKLPNDELKTMLIMAKRRATAIFRKKTSDNHYTRKIYFRSIYTLRSVAPNQGEMPWHSSPPDDGDGDHGGKVF